MEILETNFMSYEIVEKIPDGFSIWNIGDNMGRDDYIPLCEPDHENPIKAVGICEVYSVNRRTLKAIKLVPDEVKILRKASSLGAGNLNEARNFAKLFTRSHIATDIQEIIEKAISIFERITK